MNHVEILSYACALVASVAVRWANSTADNRNLDVLFDNAILAWKIGGCEFTDYEKNTMKQALALYCEF